MFSTSLSEATQPLLFLYAAEVILGLILFFIFRHFGNLYRRRFLYTWSLSWLAFCLFIICSSIVLILFEKQSYGRNILSVVGQLTSFLR